MFNTARYFFFVIKKSFPKEKTISKILIVHPLLKTGSFTLPSTTGIISSDKELKDSPS